VLVVERVTPICAGGSIPGADKLDSGFHLAGYVNEKQLACSWVITTEVCVVKRAAVRWSCVAYASGGANYHTWLISG